MNETARSDGGGLEHAMPHDGGGGSDWVGRQAVYVCFHAKCGGA